MREVDMGLWQQLTLILQWIAEPMGCDELDLHKQADTELSVRVKH
ncbi:hypothetical protein ACQUQU_10250 [Thalassolituus sp. LLYu03]